MKLLMVIGVDCSSEKFTHVDVKGGRGFVGGRVYLRRCWRHGVFGCRVYFP